MNIHQSFCKVPKEIKNLYSHASRPSRSREVNFDDVLDAYISMTF